MNGKVRGWLRPSVVFGAAALLLVVLLVGTFVFGARYARSGTDQNLTAATGPARAGAADQSTCESAAKVWAAAIADKASPDDVWTRSVIDASAVHVAAWAPSLPRELMPSGSATVTDIRADEKSCVKSVAWSSGDVWQVTLVPVGGRWVASSWDAPGGGHA